MDGQRKLPLFLVGLTGSMGCGKSHVGERFAALGAWLIDTDRVARRVVAPGSEGLRAVIERFGPSFLEVTGSETLPGLDRKKMADWIFTHPEDRVVLESMLHEWILREVRDTLLQEFERETGGPVAKTRVAILEVPLLFETGWDRLCDRTVNVACGCHQWSRLACRDNMSDAVKRQVMLRQLPEEEKNRRAHHVIDNSGSMEATSAQVHRLWLHFQEQARPHRRFLWPDPHPPTG
ncbi:MAG: dephospho-CoA kinase [Magnetococcales bacterium]|nr:dephospho-CoA kinase [Magnetococcales bacterium]